MGDFTLPGDYGYGTSDATKQAEAKLESQSNQGQGLSTVQAVVGSIGAQAPADIATPAIQRAQEPTVPDEHSLVPVLDLDTNSQTMVTPDAMVEGLTAGSFEPLPNHTYRLGSKEAIREVPGTDVRDYLGHFQGAATVFTPSEVDALNKADPVRRIKLKTGETILVPSSDVEKALASNAVAGFESAEQEQAYEAFTHTPSEAAKGKSIDVTDASTGVSASMPLDQAMLAIGGAGNYMHPTTEADRLALENYETKYGWGNESKRGYVGDKVVVVAPDGKATTVSWRSPIKDMGLQLAPHMMYMVKSTTTDATSKVSGAEAEKMIDGGGWQLWHQSQEDALAEQHKVGEAIDGKIEGGQRAIAGYAGADFSGIGTFATSPLADKQHRKETAQAVEAHPIAYLVGNMLGSAPTFGGVTGLYAGSFGIGKAGTTLQKAAAAERALQGAAQAANAAKGAGKTADMVGAVQNIERAQTALRAANQAAKPVTLGSYLTEKIGSLTGRSAVSELAASREAAAAAVSEEAAIAKAFADPTYRGGAVAGAGERFVADQVAQRAAGNTMVGNAIADNWLTSAIASDVGKAGATVGAHALDLGRGALSPAVKGVLSYGAEGAAYGALDANHRAQFEDIATASVGEGALTGALFGGALGGVLGKLQGGRIVPKEQWVSSLPQTVSTEPYTAGELDRVFTIQHATVPSKLPSSGYLRDAGKDVQQRIAAIEKTGVKDAAGLTWLKARGEEIERQRVLAGNYEAYREMHPDFAHSIDLIADHNLADKSTAWKALGMARDTNTSASDKVRIYSALSDVQRNVGLGEARYDLVSKPGMLIDTKNAYSFRRAADTMRRVLTHPDESLIKDIRTIGTQKLTAQALSREVSDAADTYHSAISALKGGETARYNFGNMSTDNLTSMYLRAAEASSEDASKIRLAVSRMRSDASLTPAETALIVKRVAEASDARTAALRNALGTRLTNQGKTELEVSELLQQFDRAHNIENAVTRSENLASDIQKATGLPKDEVALYTRDKRPVPTTPEAALSDDEQALLLAKLEKGEANYRQTGAHLEEQAAIAQDIEDSIFPRRFLESIKSQVKGESRGSNRNKLIYFYAHAYVPSVSIVKDKVLGNVGAALHLNKAYQAIVGTRALAGSSKPIEALIAEETGGSGLLGMLDKWRGAGASNESKARISGLIKSYKQAVRSRSNIAARLDTIARQRELVEAQLAATRGMTREGAAAIVDPQAAQRLAEARRASGIIAGERSAVADAASEMRSKIDEAMARRAKLQEASDAAQRNVGLLDKDIEALSSRKHFEKVSIAEKLNDKAAAESYKRNIDKLQRANRSAVKKAKANGTTKEAEGYLNTAEMHKKASSVVLNSLKQQRKRIAKEVEQATADLTANQQETAALRADVAKQGEVAAQGGQIAGQEAAVEASGAGDIAQQMTDAEVLASKAQAAEAAAQLDVSRAGSIIGKQDQLGTLDTQLEKVALELQEQEQAIHRLNGRVAREVEAIGGPGSIAYNMLMGGFGGAVKRATQVSLSSGQTDAEAMAQAYEDGDMKEVYRLFDVATTGHGILFDHPTLIARALNGVPPTALPQVAKKLMIAKDLPKPDGGVKPAPQVIMHWARTKHAADKPLSVVASVLGGHVTQEEVRTIKVMYPALYKSWSEGFALSAEKGELSPQQLDAASIFTGRPLSHLAATPPLAPSNGAPQESTDIKIPSPPTSADKVTQ